MTHTFAPRAVRVAAALASAGILALTAAAPASAADEVSIDHVETADGRVSLVLAVDGVPAGATADPRSVQVDVDGRTVESTAKVISAGDVERTTVLVLDASNSMLQRDKFASATAAVDAFLTAAPADVRIGLVAFAGDIGEVIAPTTDHDSVRTALADITLSKGTAVYDAIAAGLEQVGTDGSRSLLVLSDGGDTSSSTTLDVVTKDATDAGVIVDVVSLANPENSQTMSALADGTGGQVIPAEQGALQDVFSAQADALAQQLVVTFDRPQDAADEVNLTVSVDAGGTTFSDAAFIPIGSVARGPDIVSSGKSLVGTPGMLLGSAALALGLAGVLATALCRTATSRPPTGDWMPTSEAERPASGSPTPRPTSRGLLWPWPTRSSPPTSRPGSRSGLPGAGSGFTAAEWMLLHAGTAIGAALVGFVLGGAGLAVLGLFLGAVGPWLYLKFRHSRRLSRFNGQLAETLTLMAGGLQAGLSTPTGRRHRRARGPRAHGGRARRALVEHRLGIDIDDALESVGHRMESEDFGWVVMAIRIQREVGGNLSEILNTVADTLREREYLRRQVKALSAEGRLSALDPRWYASGRMFIYMCFANHEYVRVLYTTTHRVRC